jgi:hypothetical protein
MVSVSARERGEQAARRTPSPSHLAGDVDASQRVRLVVLSFLMLFLELALIRWTASNDIHLAYLTNFVLLASFLGIGAGFIRATAGRGLLGFAPLPLALLVGFVLLFPVRLTNDGNAIQLHGAFGWSPLPKWVGLPVIFVLTVAVMACVANGVARLFGLFPPLDAYRLDIAGSLAGIVVFSGLAFLELPPVAWAAIVTAVFLGLVGRQIRWWQVCGLAIVVGLLLFESVAGSTRWSPYYKVAWSRSPGPVAVAGIRTHDTLAVSANAIPHQTAYPISGLRRLEPFYTFPYRHAPRPLRDVLIVGAGTGNDVAIALSEGARHVDAVEIDPVLQDLGRRYHPDRPYQDPGEGRRLHDVQLLRAVSARPLRGTARECLRASAVRGAREHAGRPTAGGADGSAHGGDHRVREDVARP